MLLNLLELFTAGIAVHKFSLCFVCKDQWVSWQKFIEVRKTIIPDWKCHENEEKIENDDVLRNDHKIKTTQPISMILVWFFSENNVSSDEMKICYIVEYQSNENRAFRFCLDTRYKWMAKRFITFLLYSKFKVAVTL